MSGAWPVLDAAALHGIAGEVVALIEPHTESDPAGILASILVEFGAVVGPSPHALADSAPHPARLFVVLVGETAKGRKGSAAANVSRLMSGVDPDFFRERRLNGFGSGEAIVDTLRGDRETAVDPRLLVSEPEFARILATAKRDGSTLSSIVRQAWDGGRLAVRSRAGTTVAEDSHVCVLGHVSADELRAKLADTEVAGGFANRFLFVCVRRSKILPSGGNLDDGDFVGLIRRFALLASHAATVGIMRRTPAAEALWSDLYYEMAADEPGGLLAAIIARDSAQVLRLSVTYALLDSSSRIDVEHVRAAWALWSYCRASAAHIFGESTGDIIADTLIAAARRAGPAGLDGRERHALFSGHASVGQLDAAMDVLVEKALAVIETEETTGRRRVLLKAVEGELRELRGLRGTKRISDSQSIPDEHCELSELANKGQNADKVSPYSDVDLERLFAESE